MFCSPLVLCLSHTPDYLTSNYFSAPITRISWPQPDPPTMLKVTPPHIETFLSARLPFSPPGYLPLPCPDILSKFLKPLPVNLDLTSFITSNVSLVEKNVQGPITLGGQAHWFSQREQWLEGGQTTRVILRTTMTFVP